MYVNYMNLKEYGKTGLQVVYLRIKILRLALGDCPIFWRFI